MKHIKSFKIVVEGNGREIVHYLMENNYIEKTTWYTGHASSGNYYSRDNGPIEYIIGKDTKKVDHLKEYTLAQFKEEHMRIQEDEWNKNIIGYKMVKPEYKEAVEAIAGSGFGFSAGWKFNFEINSRVYRKLKEAGVLDLWFEPIYNQSEIEQLIKEVKEKIKIEPVYNQPEIELEFVERLTSYNHLFTKGKIYKVNQISRRSIIIIGDNGDEIAGAKVEFKPSTEQAYKGQLIKEAEKRFGQINKGDKFTAEWSNDTEYVYQPFKNNGWQYNKHLDELRFNGFIFYRKGKWVERVKEQKVEYLFLNIDADRGTTTASFNFKMPYLHPIEFNNLGYRLQETIKEWLKENTKP